jgi:hypothetical protein
LAVQAALELVVCPVLLTHLVVAALGLLVLLVEL